MGKEWAVGINFPLLNYRFSVVITHITSLLWNIFARIQLNRHRDSFVYDSMKQDMNPSLRNNMRRYNMPILKHSSILWIILFIITFNASWWCFVLFSSYRHDWHQSTQNAQNIWQLYIYSRWIGTNLMAAYFFYQLPIKRHVVKNLFPNYHQNQVYDVNT